MTLERCSSCFSLHLAPSPRLSLHATPHLALLLKERIVRPHRTDLRVHLCHAVVSLVARDGNGVTRVANETSGATAAVISRNPVGLGPNRHVLTRGGVKGPVPAVVPRRALTSVEGHPVSVDVVHLDNGRVDIGRGGRHARPAEVGRRALPRNPSVYTVIPLGTRIALRSIREVHVVVVRARWTQNGLRGAFGAVVVLWTVPRGRAVAGTEGPGRAREAGSRAVSRIVRPWSTPDFHRRSCRSVSAGRSCVAGDVIARLRGEGTGKTNVTGGTVVTRYTVAGIDVLSAHETEMPRSARMARLSQAVADRRRAR